MRDLAPRPDCIARWLSEEPDPRELMRPFDLPAPEQLAPAVVSGLIARGLERDVPALKARGEYLD